MILQLVQHYTNFVRRTAYNNENWSVGFQHKFEQIGYYKIILRGSNTADGDILYQAQKVFNVEDFIKIYPSLGYFDSAENPYLPYQGIDLNFESETEFSELEDYEQTSLVNLINYDLDERPQLGTFYHNDQS